MTPQDFKSSCRARFASGVGSIPTHSRHLLAGPLWAALLVCAAGAGARAAAAPRDSSGAAPATVDTSGLIRSRLPAFKPRRERLPREIPARPADTTRVTRAEEPEGPVLHTAIDSAAAFPIYEPPGHSDPRFAPGSYSDSTRPAAVAYPRPKPGLVMLRSALVPGWGQLTNGRWWKAVLAIGLEGTLEANAIKAGRDARSAEDRYRVTGVAVDSLDALDFRERQRGYWWWTAGAIGLSMLDAYVDAHFKNFDVTPVASSMPRPRGSATWLGLSVRWHPAAQF